MIKGVRLGGVGKAMSYLDTLVVPVIDNTPHEEDLTEFMAEVRAVLWPAVLLLTKFKGDEEIPRCSRCSRQETWGLCVGCVADDQVDRRG
jgi:hypothetical protein